MGKLGAGEDSRAMDKASKRPAIAGSEQRDAEIAPIKTAIRVRRDLCRCCGLCALDCPQGAITIRRDGANIDQGRCDLCLRCLDICPQGAIAAETPAPVGDLGETVASLKQKVDALLTKIDNLTH